MTLTPCEAKAKTEFLRWIKVSSTPGKPISAMPAVITTAGKQYFFAGTYYGLALCREKAALARKLGFPAKIVPYPFKAPRARIEGKVERRKTWCLYLGRKR